ncbi:copper transporter [Thalassiella azotivora]
MIDFRYHLVSLVSVFMALAIGVVLGAGPLRDAIGDQLSNQVEGLLEDKTALQQAVANRDARIAERDAFISAVAPQLVSGQLGGRSVVLVTLPGVQDQDVEQVSAQLDAAGASVSGRVALGGSWFDPGRGEERADVADAQGALLPQPPADDAEAEEVLADVLAHLVVTTDLLRAGQADEEARAGLEALASEDLVSVEGAPWSRASVALVVAPGPADLPEADDTAWQDAEEAAVRTLVTALDEAGGGTVLAGPLSSAGENGLVAAVRGSDAASVVSTVDTLDAPTGRVAAVLALREQLAGGVGHYGAGEGATAPLPEEVLAGTVTPGADG